MKKANKINPEEYDDGMLPEYDFRGKKGIRGKYYRDLQKGYTVRIHNEDGTVTIQHFGPIIRLEPDVAEYFPDSESVNNALRTLIALVPEKRIGETKAKYKVSKKSAKRVAAKK
ncbi:MAG: hypothetical protein C4557_13265 [Anaerolineaceae bacterium]|jgi:hypothetical protein|nr:MAG: hypothetical protein C4557_13265 [Anaerolineaceae bacterium]